MLLWVQGSMYMSKCMCVCVVSYEGADAVSCGSDEEARLYGCSTELHFSSQSCTPTGKPKVGSDIEWSIVFAMEMWMVYKIK